MVFSSGCASRTVARSPALILSEGMLAWKRMASLTRYESALFRSSPSRSLRTRTGTARSSLSSPSTFALLADRTVDLLAAQVIRGDHESVFRAIEVGVCDSRKAVLPFRALVNAALFSQFLYAFSNFSIRHQDDGSLQVGIFLPNDFVELCRLHAGVLQFAEYPAGLDGLVLPYITHKNDSVIGPDVL